MINHKPSVVKKVFKIEGMDCPSCATLIESELEDKGINCSCSFAKQTIEVELVNKSVKKEVDKTVKNLGFALSED